MLFLASSRPRKARHGRAALLGAFQSYQRDSCQEPQQDGTPEHLEPGCY